MDPKKSIIEDFIYFVDFCEAKKSGLKLIFTYINSISRKVYHKMINHEIVDIIAFFKMQYKG